MPTQDKNKPTRKDRLRTIISGVQRHFPSGSLILAGQTFPVNQLVLRIQQDIDATDATIQARSAWTEKVQVEKNSHQALAPVLRALHSLVIAQFGEAKDAASILGDFGYTPRKVAKRPVEEKAGAAAKSRATRKARNTMGKVQKSKVKGAVQAPAPAVAGPGTTPQGGSGTPKPNA